MKPNCHQNGVKNRVLCKYGKSNLDLAWLSPNGVPGVELGSNDQPKIDQTIRPRRDCILASMFDSMLVPIWLHFNSQIHQRPIQNRGPEKVWASLGRLQVPRRLPNASWTPLGRLLGGSWTGLGSQNDPKSRLGGALGAFWAAPGSKTPPRRLLDASWAALGRLLSPLGRQVVANMVPTWLQKSPKSIKTRCQDAFPS